MCETLAVKNQQIGHFPKKFPFQNFSPVHVVSHNLINLMHE